jgi:propanol-preferring alcohol dehydrogenase
MLAYRIVGWQEPPRLMEVEVPEPGAGQVLVKVAGNGLCHSDISMQQMPAELGESLGWRVPFTLGHEIAGWVDEVGDGVDGLRAGDPVALVSPASCGDCSYCAAGLDSACIYNAAGRGYGRDGGLAEYVLVDSARPIIPLGGLDPVAAGPLTDAGATSHHAVARVLPRLHEGATAVVIGAGGLGSFAVQLLRALSAATIIAIDNNPARLEIVSRLGAHEVIEGVDRATRRALLERTGGRGAEAVLDFVGVDATIAAGIGATAKAGAFGLVGAGGGTLTRPWFGTIPQDAEVFTFQGSNIADAHAVIALAAAGEIVSEVDVFPLADVDVAYARLEAGELRGRAVVTPG